MNLLHKKENKYKKNEYIRKIKQDFFFSEIIKHITAVARFGVLEVCNDLQK